MKSLIKKFLIFLSIILYPCVVAAVSNMGTEPTYITADQVEYSKKNDLIVARGNVEVHHKGKIIMGDLGRLDNKTGDGLVTGNVLIVDTGDYIVCKKAAFNIKNDKGIIYDGSGIIASKYYISGKEIVKLNKDRYKVLKGALTTCCDKNPPWKINSYKFEVQLEHYAHITLPSLRLKNIPVLYFPYFIFPVKTKRQSGLLHPGIGGGGKDGFIFRNSFFWAISESKDATLEWERKDLRGDRFDLEYRYVLSRNASGIVNGTYYEDRDPETQKDTIFWKILYDHNHLFPYGIQGIVHVDQMSESNIDREFELEDLETRSRRNTDSHIRLSKNWSTRNIQILTRRKDNTEFDYLERYEEFPDLSFNNQSEQIYSTPLYFSFESSFKGFRRKREKRKLEADEIAKEDKIEVNRTDIYPKLLLPIPLFPWFSLTPSIAYRDTYYSNGNKSRGFYKEFYELGITTSGPKFYKIFELGDLAVKHLVEPTATYSHTSKIDKDVKDQVVAFDNIDTLGTVENPNNIVTYSLTNRFLKKIGDEPASEVARLTFTQTYDIQTEKRKQTDTAPRRPFSYIQTTLETNIIPPLKFSYYNTYDVYNRVPLKDTINLDINFPGLGYFTLERRFERSSDGKNIHDDPNSITDIGTLGINLFDRLKFEMGRLYDELNHDVIENDYSIVYSYDCWEISYDMVNRRWNPNNAIEEDRYETKFFITVTLKDVAVIGKKQTFGFVKQRF